jgi:hypothetical protein
MNIRRGSCPAAGGDGRAKETWDMGPRGDLGQRSAMTDESNRADQPGRANGTRPELLVCRGFGWNVCTACQCRCRAVRTICPARLRASKAVAYLCRVVVLPAHIPGACLLVYVGANVHAHNSACPPYANVYASVYTLKNAILAYTHTHTHTHTQTLSLSLIPTQGEKVKHTQQSLYLALSRTYQTPHGEIPLLDVAYQTCH